MKYFEFEAAAKRYAAGRPFIHPVVVAHVRAFTGGHRFPVAVDVACGTGQSTVAVKDICGMVVAVDRSPEMLAEATKGHGIHYVRSGAEALPVAAGTCDLVTVGLAFHWFERAPFLREARRVLKPGGWLVLYQNFFYGRMRENPAFEVWHREQYLAKYPVPPRNEAPFGSHDAARHGFTFVGEESYESDVEFSLDDITLYVSTQTNMIVAIETGRISVRRALEWLRDGIAPYFSRDQETFEFGGWIIYLQRD